MSFRIDMQDHFSYVDGRLSPYNFLRFSSRTWRLLTCGVNYQNRLRYPDYLRLFAAAGLEIVAEEVTQPTNGDLEALARIELAPEFRSYASDDVATRALAVVVRPAVAAARLPDRAQELEDVGPGGGSRIRSRAGP
jgi:hypothetical protein